jgi:hypothetical protein
MHFSPSSMLSWSHAIWSSRAPSHCPSRQYRPHRGIKCVPTSILHRTFLIVMQHGINYNCIGKIYVALLVLITQRLAVSAALARRQKLTSIHDMCGAWSGIGAAINSLWQQTKIAASPSTTLVILTYLGCISGLHIISSSIIQFQPFNNPMTITIQSRLAWPPPSVDIGSFDWRSITSMLPMLPTLSGLSANGLTNSTLYDIPSLEYPFTGVVVNGTTVSAECGLLSNTSAVTLDNLGDLMLLSVGLARSASHQKVRMRGNISAVDIDYCRNR